MSVRPDAHLAWGVDLGREDTWRDDHPLAAYRGGEFAVWCETVLPGLFIDVEARYRELTAHADTFDPEHRDVYVAARDAILACYDVPVGYLSYGYEGTRHALVLSRSYTGSPDWGCCPVDPDSVERPTSREVEDLWKATDALGLPRMMPVLLLMVALG